MAADARKEAVARCVSDIEVADFIALDFEFSGLFLNVDRPEGPPMKVDDYLKKCFESVPSFVPLQIGICCGRQLKDRGVWELRSHEFNLWPASKRIFSVDFQSLRFLRAHNFDFNALFEYAFTYCRLPPLGDPGARPAALPPGQATKVLSALRESRVPLVLHNGLLDLLHLYDKFLGELPGTWADFTKAWSSQFPLVFDTRLIGQEGRFQVLKHSGGLSLGDLHRHLLGCRSNRMVFDRAGPLGEGRSPHGSSGLDATLTAEVFLMEMDMWLCHSSSSSRKRPRKDPPAKAPGSAEGQPDQAEAAAEAGEDGAGWTVVSHGKKRGREATAAGAGEQAPDGLTSADLLETHEVCRRFHNRIAIVSAATGSLSLVPPAAAESGSALPLPAGSAGPAVAVAMGIAPIKLVVGARPKP